MRETLNNEAMSRQVFFAGITFKEGRKNKDIEQEGQPPMSITETMITHSCDYQQR